MKLRLRLAGASRIPGFVGSPRSTRASSRGGLATVSPPPLDSNCRLRLAGASRILGFVGSPRLRLRLAGASRIHGFVGSPRLRLRLANQGGFTLVELLVVVIILGLLVGLVGPRLLGRVGQSKTATARAQVELFGATLDQYKLDIGSYPTTAQGLDALVKNPNVPNWAGPYLKKNTVPRDPWGNPYKYACCPGQNGDYDLWTEGADNAPGGEGENADVTSWEST